MMQIKIQRYHPEVDKKPYWQIFQVDIKAHALIMVLDALIWIKDNVDDTLSFRRSCREGVCGSDGMNINGKNGLACITPLRQYKNLLVIRAFPGMPIIRDLISDMTLFFKQYEKVEPYLKTNTLLPEKEFIQSIEEREKIDGLYECVLCGCCSSACPSYWWNPDKFLGPAALLQSARFIRDSRDKDSEKRGLSLEDHYQLFRCRSIMNCVSVCPKNLNPTKAISDIRLEMIKSKK